MVWWNVMFRAHALSYSAFPHVLQLPFMTLLLHLRGPKWDFSRYAKFPLIRSACKHS